MFCLKRPVVVLWMMLWAMPGFMAGAASASGTEISGVVTDPEGRVVVGARVLAAPVAGTSAPAASVGSAEEQRVVTDGEGRFRVEISAAEEVRLVVEANRFEPYVATVLVDGQEVSHDVELRLAAVSRQILVTAAMPELAGESIVSQGDLESRGAGDLAGALRGQSGLAGVRRGPINLDPTVRGLQETQVAMFVDGTRTFAAGPARMDSGVSHVSPHAVSGVKVVKGPYALTWGSGALSALDVQLFRPEFARDSDFSFAGRLGTQYYDAQGVLDSSAGVWGSNETFRFYLSAGRRAGDDFEDGNGTLLPGDFESTDGRWSFGFKLAPSVLLEYSGGTQGQDDIDYPGRLLDASYFETRSHALDFTWTPEGRSFTEVSAQLYSNRKEHRMNNDEKPTAQPAPGRTPPFALRVDLLTESNTSGGRFAVGLDQGAWNWRFGGDSYRSEQTADRSVFRRRDDRLLFQDIVWPDAETDAVGVYGRGVHRTEAWQLGMALRVDNVKAEAGEVSPFYSANTTGDLDSSDTDVSIAFSGQYRLGQAGSLVIGAGSAVRTPSSLERYSDRFPSTKFQLAAEFMGNPQLEPERSIEFNVGVQQSLGSFRLEGDFFYRQIDDYITVAPDPTLPRRLPLSPPVVYRYINGDDAIFFGGEVSLRHRVCDRFDWWASVDYLWAEDKTFDEPVLGIQPLTGRVGARWRGSRDRWWVSAEATLVDEQDRVAAARFEKETPGYEIFDLRASFRLSKVLHLRAGVENLGDEAYAEHLNSPNPFNGQRIFEAGRSFYGGLEVRF